MTKRELINKCATQIDMTKIAIEQVIDYATLFLGRELVQTGKTKIPNIGSLSVQNRQGRNYFDINAGDVRRIPAINTIKFTPSSELKSMIKRRIYEQD